MSIDRSGLPVVAACVASWLVTVLAGCSSSSRGGATEASQGSPAAPATASPAPGPAVSPSAGVTEAQAREIALRTAAAEGYDNATYPVKSVEQEADGTWLVFLEHLPPTPPGAHCMVTVGPDGTARLAHGE